MMKSNPMRKYIWNKKEIGQAWDYFKDFKYTKQTYLLLEGVYVTLFVV